MHVQPAVALGVAGLLHLRAELRHVTVHQPVDFLVHGALGGLHIFPGKVALLVQLILDGILDLKARGKAVRLFRQRGQRQKQAQQQGQDSFHAQSS